jgi:hypothetical protein
MKFTLTDKLEIASTALLALTFTYANCVLLEMMETILIK